MHIAILGGAFDPPHLGHLAVATSACAHLCLDRVLWVPTPQSSHKLAAADPAQRCQMVSLAIAPYDVFQLVALPQANRPNFGLWTFQYLTECFPQCDRWFWLLGLDTFQTLPHWYNIQALALQCCWVVAPRPSCPPPLEHPSPKAASTLTQSVEPDRVAVMAVVQRLAEQGLAIQWQPLPMPLLNISSTDIRQRCSDRRPIHHLVPEAIAQYIATHHLYSPDA